MSRFGSLTNANHGWTVKVTITAYHNLFLLPTVTARVNEPSRTVLCEGPGFDEVSRTRPCVVASSFSPSLLTQADLFEAWHRADLRLVTETSPA